MKRSTILVVDDEQSYLKTIANFLDSEAYKVVQATNGKVACKVAKQFRPDIIIMDWEMPEMNGIEAIEYFQTQEEIKNIPVIMATGVMTSATNLQTALDAGAVDYIRKPIEKIELIARINSTLKLSLSYQKIQKQSDRLEELNREKDGLISIVAHDLQSPLNQITALADVMLMMEKGDEVNLKKSLELVKYVTTNAGTLITDLMDINSLEQSGNKLVYAPVNVNDLIQELIEAFQHHIDQKQLKIECVLGENITLETDYVVLKRILSNLFSNAIKFSPMGRLIKVEAHAMNNVISFSIHDQAGGISSEDQKKMYQKFQRLSALPTAGEHSTGLGLAIVKSLVEKLKGSIELQSELGIGSIFTVSFNSQKPSVDSI